MKREVLQSIENEIAETKKRLVQLEEKYERVKSYTVEQQVADIMHAKFCRWNHTDGCGYYYSEWDDPNEERKRQLEKAQKFITALTDPFLKKEAVPIVDYCKRIIDTL